MTNPVNNNKTEIIRIRPHHIMCVQNYIGKGYSKEFCIRMDELCNMLKEDPQVQIVKGCDDICGACPERKDEKCTSSFKVDKMDEDVARTLGLSYSERVSWKKAAQSVKEMIFSTDMFRKICSTCRWFDICKNLIKPYRFYGWEHADIKDARGLTPRDYYDILTDIWAEDTCAPRLRDGWSKDNKTLGQCSVTAFLMQDIFGGKVYGIKRSGGTFHCFNDVNGCVFDLTSEQFMGEKLDYTNCPEQYREVHFAKEEKKLRYELLKERLDKRFEEQDTVSDISGNSGGTHTDMAVL